MLASSKFRRVQAALAALVSCSILPTHAADGGIRINESALNKFAAAAEPMTVTGRFNFKVGGVSICNSAFTVQIKDAKFRINTGGLVVTANVTAEWCNLPFAGNLTSNGDVSYSSANSTIRLTVQNSSVQPKFTISVFGASFTVKLPIHINIGTPFNPPGIPVSTAHLTFQTANGPQILRVAPQNLTLTKQSGVILLDADARVW